MTGIAENSLNSGFSCYCFRTLLRGYSSTATPVGGVAPALEVLAPRADRRVDAELLPDQVADGTPGPQRAGDPQFLGALGVDEVLDVAGLLLVEGAARALRPPRSARKAKRRSPRWRRRSTSG